MKSTPIKSLSQLCNEMYDKPQEVIDENNKRFAMQRDVNKQILDLLKSQGISDEEIQNFVNFIKNQKMASKGNYEIPDKYQDRSPQ